MGERPTCACGAEATRKLIGAEAGPRYTHCDRCFVRAEAASMGEERIPAVCTSRTCSWRGEMHEAPQVRGVPRCPSCNTPVGREVVDAESQVINYPAPKEGAPPAPAACAADQLPAARDQADWDADGVCRRCWRKKGVAGPCEACRAGTAASTESGPGPAPAGAADQLQQQRGDRWRQVAQAFRDATSPEAEDARQGECDPFLERAQTLYNAALQADVAAGFPAEPSPCRCPLPFDRGPHVAGCPWAKAPEPGAPAERLRVAAEQLVRHAQALALNPGLSLVGTQYVDAVRAALADESPEGGTPC